MLHYRLPCSCFISFPLTHTSLFMLHLISFSSHFIHHVFISFSPQSISFVSSTISPSHSSHSYLPYLVALILHGHSTLLPVSLFSQSRLWIRWFYYSLSLYIKQEIQQGESQISRGSLFSFFIN